MNPVKYVRRGFSIRLDLYNRMRENAARLGIYPKDWLSAAIKQKLISEKKKSKLKK